MAVTSKYTASELVEEYNIIQAAMVADTSLRNSYENKLKDLFTKFGFDNNQKAQVMAQFITTAYTVDMTELTKLSIASLDSQTKASENEARVKVISKQCESEQYKSKLIDQQSITEAMNTKKIKREIYAVDEALKVKKAEFLANVTSFAVNSDGAAGAQSLITDMNTKISELTPISTAATIIAETTNTSQVTIEDCEV